MNTLTKEQKEIISLQVKREIETIKLENATNKAELINSLRECLEAVCIKKEGAEPVFTNVFGGEKHQIISDKIIEIVKTI